jgi:hypothetical protein
MLCGMILRMIGPSSDESVIRLFNALAGVLFAARGARAEIIRGSEGSQCKLIEPRGIEPSPAAAQLPGAVDGALRQIGPVAPPCPGNLPLWYRILFIYRS